MNQQLRVTDNVDKQNVADLEFQIRSTLRGHKTSASLLIFASLLLTASRKTAGLPALPKWPRNSFVHAAARLKETCACGSRRWCSGKVAASYAPVRNGSKQRPTPPSAIRNAIGSVKFSVAHMMQ